MMNDKKENEIIIAWIDTETMSEEELLEDDIYIEEEK
jgi:hypothetical protein